MLIAFPYSTATRTAIRPAMVILDTGNSDIVAARITTQMHQTPYDILISDWQGAGLLAPSVVRLHKLATLEKRLIHRRLGQLRHSDRQRVSTLMRQVYGTW